MESLGDICGKAAGLLLTLFLVAACPARADAPAPHAAHQAGANR